MKVLQPFSSLFRSQNVPFKKLSTKAGKEPNQGLCHVFILSVVIFTLIVTILTLAILLTGYLKPLSTDTSPALKPKWSVLSHIWLQRYLENKTSRANYKSTTAQTMADGRVMSCYYNMPNVDKPTGNLMPQDLNPFLCTHINLAFADIINKEIHLDDNQIKVIQDVVQLKHTNKELKVLLSVGGSGNNGGFSDMVVDHASRKIFIKSLKSTLKHLNLDGVDLDWEFPAFSNENTFSKKKRERQHFSQLLREIRTEYYREKKNYLLTVATAAQQVIVDTSYDVDQLNLYTDYVNIMTYDFHVYSKITPYTGLNSPLFPRKEEKLLMSTLNINNTVHMYLTKGLNANKIVVGIPTYGHTFNLVNADNPSIGSPASGYGSISSSGFVDYPVICKFINRAPNKPAVEYESDAKVPYTYQGHNWVSFESPQSVMEKAKYIKENNLGGAMVYSLNADDYNGTCQDGDAVKFPLSNTISTVLFEKGK